MKPFGSVGIRVGAEDFHEATGFTELSDGLGDLGQEIPEIGLIERDFLVSRPGGGGQGP